jgi:hypothetical protein
MRTIKSSLKPVGAAAVCLGILFTFGCTDAAEEDYKKCEQLDKEHKYEDALKACREASQKDARSIYGEKALALENKLYDKIEKQKKEQAAEEAEYAESRALDNANAKVSFVLQSTPPKDPDAYSERCMARNRAYENTYNCEPKDPSTVKEGDGFPFKEECMVIAKSRGCMPFFEKSPTKLFCCTK